MALDTTVHYPFHPLYNKTLKVIAWPKIQDGSATVELPNGKTLKIPIWMLEVDAAKIKIVDQPIFPLPNLVTLLDLIRLNNFTLDCSIPKEKFDRDTNQNGATNTIDNSNDDAKCSDSHTGTATNH